MVSGGERESPTIFNIFQHDYPGTSPAYSDNPQIMDVDVRVLSRDEISAHKDKIGRPIGNYAIQVYPFPHHQDEESTEPSMRVPREASDINALKDRHEPLIAFAPYLRHLLDRLSVEMPFEEIESADLECYDHISKCKGSSSGNRPRDQGLGTPEDHANESEVGPPPYDPGNWVHYNSQQVADLSRDRNRQALDSKLSRLFDSPSAPDKGFRLDQQRLTWEDATFTNLHGVSTKEPKPGRFTLTTLQLFSETAPDPELTSTSASTGRERAWPYPEDAIMDRSTINNPDVPKFVRRMTNEEFLSSLTHEDKEMSKILSWCDRVTQILPFRKGLEDVEDEDEDHRDYLLSSLSLTCSFSTSSWKSGQSYTFKASVRQQQYRCRRDAPDSYCRKNTIIVEDNRPYHEEIHLWPRASQQEW